MAEEKIGYDDLFDRSLFQPVIDSLQKLVETLDKASEAFKSEAKTAVDNLVKSLSQLKSASDVSAASLREIAKNVSQVEKAQKALSDLQKEKEKLQARLNKLNAALDENTKSYVDLQARIKKAKNELRDLVKAREIEIKFSEAAKKANENAFASYDELTEVLEVLRARAKDLAAQGRQNTEEYKKLAETVQELDQRVKAIDTSLGQFQRLVGSYKEAILEAFSQISASAVGVEGSFGRISVLLIDLVVNTYRAQKGIKGIASAFSLLAKTLKSVAVIAALELLVSLLEKIRENLFPSSEDFLYTNLLRLQNDLIQRRVTLLERILDYEAELAEIADEDLTSQLKRIEVQKKIVDLQILEAEAQKETLEAEIELRRAQLARAKDAAEQIGFFGKTIRFLFDKLASFAARFSESVANAIRATSEEILSFLAKYVGDQKAALEAEKDLSEALERKVNIEETLIRLRGERKKLDKEALEIQEKALETALSRLENVENEALTQAQRIVERYNEGIKALEKSYQEALRVLGAGFENERRLLEEAFRERQAILQANYARELSETVNQYIQQAANLVRETLPAASEFVRLSTELIVKEQVRALDSLERELASFIAVLEKEAEKNNENAAALRAQAEEAKKLLEAFSKLRKAVELNVIAEVIRQEIELFRERDRLFEASSKKAIALLTAEKIAREKELNERKLALETEKLLAEQRSLADVLLLRSRRLNLRKAFEEERKINEERLRLEREIEERRLAEEKRRYEERLANLRGFLQAAEAEAKKFRDDEVPAQLRKLIEDLRFEVEATEAAYADLLNRSAESAARYAQRLNELAVESARKYAEIARKEVQDLLEATEQALDSINKLIERKSELRLQSLEAEKSQIDKTIDVLIARAEAGSLAADQSISELLERKKQIELQEQEIRRQQQRRELLLTALQAYSAAIQRGSQSPLADTIRDLTAISQLIQSLPTFYSGAEYVSADKFPKIPHLAKDAFLARLHEGERVVPAHINAKLGGIKNEDLPKLVSEKREVSFDFDSFRNALITIIREQNRKNRYIDRL